MSRKGWRVSRALRVLLACLALWLPARTAGAAYAPADVVVMVAGGAEATATGDARSVGASAQRDGRRIATEARSLSSAAHPSRFRKRQAPNGFAPATTNRAVAPPLYLVHCALLR